ncbi:unnamed protein product [Ectocarpus sp. 13 AM-2016]
MCTQTGVVTHHEQRRRAGGGGVTAESALRYCTLRSSLYTAAVTKRAPSFSRRARGEAKRWRCKQGGEAATSTHISAGVCVLATQPSVVDCYNLQDVPSSYHRKTGMLVDFWQPASSPVR